jgi:hypothetical protein
MVTFDDPNLELHRHPKKLERRQSLRWQQSFSLLLLAVKKTSVEFLNRLHILCGHLQPKVGQQLQLVQHPTKHLKQEDLHVELLEQQLQLDPLHFWCH